jgi:hypothetical protein
VANDYSNAVALWMQLHKKVFIRNLMEGFLAKLPVIGKDFFNVFEIAGLHVR